MNIGILTHCIANNFGANLQALSTACYLKNQGYTPIFINWDSYLKNRSKKVDQIQFEIHRTFLGRHGIYVSNPCITNEDFVALIKEFDIHNIIIGSDAVFTVSSWVDRLRVNRRGIRLVNVSEDKQFPNPFWIPFADQVQDCNFYYLSPSCQSSSYRYLPRLVLKNMRYQLNRASYISARDTCTQNMLHYILGKGKEIQITPDPVWGFLSNVKDIPSKDHIVEKYGLVDNYILFSYYKGGEMPSEWHDCFRHLANSQGIEVYSLPMPQGHFVSNLPQIKLPVDSLDWFALIKYSSGYVGNNMHPVIVSMHNIVPFFSIDHHGKNIWKFHFEKTSKVYDLLNMADMMEYRISSHRKHILSPDYVLNKLLEFDKKKCMAFADKMYADYCEMMKTICSLFRK